MIEYLLELLQISRKSYSKTFLFDTNSIDKFILQKNSFDGYDLRVMLKQNNKIETIWQIHSIKKYDLEGLAFLLNKRVDNSNEIMITSNN